MLLQTIAILGGEGELVLEPAGCGKCTCNTRCNHVCRVRACTRFVGKRSIILHRVAVDDATDLGPPAIITAAAPPPGPWSLANCHPLHQPLLLSFFISLSHQVMNDATPFLQGGLGSGAGDLE